MLQRHKASQENKQSIHVWYICCCCDVILLHCERHVRCRGSIRETVVLGDDATEETWSAATATALPCLFALPKLDPRSQRRQCCKIGTYTTFLLGQWAFLSGTRRPTIRGRSLLRCVAKRNTYFEKVSCSLLWLGVISRSELSNTFWR